MLLHFIRFPGNLRKQSLSFIEISPDSKSLMFCCRWNQIHDHGTSHISIIDSQRNALSMTTTINAYFGSKFLSPSTGIILNNEMDDFSVPANTSPNIRPPAPPNFIYPGKRPLSSMTPTIFLKVHTYKSISLISSSIN